MSNSNKTNDEGGSNPNGCNDDFGVGVNAGTETPVP
jgi:hypothetical protein